MDLPPQDGPDPAAPPMCSHCGWIPAEEGYAMLLCGRCRELLAKRPFPQWIKLSCISIAILLAVAAARSVGAF